MSIPKASIEFAVFVTGVAGTIGGLYAFFRYGSYQATVKLQNDSIAALQKNNEILTQAVEDSKKSHIESMREIGRLEGQVKIYKDLQLDRMASAMEAIHSTNSEILAALRGNVPKEAVDGGLLVHTASDTKNGEV